VRVDQLHGARESLQRQGMTTFTQLAPAPPDPPEPFTDRLRLAVAAYLADLAALRHISLRILKGGWIDCCLRIRHSCVVAVRYSSAR
jgi:hypothetical protein